MDIFQKLQSYMDYSFGKTNEKVEIKYEDTFFKSVTFTGYDLNNTEFLGVVFSQCDFTDVYLSGSNLSGSTFEQCTFNNNIFRKGMAEYASFVQTDLKKIDSFRTSFYKSRFSNLLIEKSVMKNCVMADTVFSNVTFSDVDLAGSSFRRSGFANVKFVRCILNDVTFEDNLGLESVEFIDC